MASGRADGVFDGNALHTVAADSTEDSAVLKGSGYDAEKIERRRRLNRICSPLIPANSDAGSTLTVGKLQELEESNQIKYRTCSWKKVNRIFSSNLEALWQQLKRWGRIWQLGPLLPCFQCLQL